MSRGRATAIAQALLLVALGFGTAVALILCWIDEITTWQARR